MRTTASLSLAFAIVSGLGCEQETLETEEATPEGTDMPSPTAAPQNEPRPVAKSKPTISTSTACGTLDRAECLTAKHCTLHFVETMKYDCLASKGPCEEDLQQRDTKTCAKRDGCEWDPGSCYCPFPGYGSAKVADKDKNAGAACGCGGGPPPRCKTKA